MKKNILSVNYMRLVCFVCAVSICIMPAIGSAQANCEYDSSVSYSSASYNGDVVCDGAGTNADLTNTGQRYLVAAQVAAGLLIAGTAGFLLFTRMRKTS